MTSRKYSIRDASLKSDHAVEPIYHVRINEADSPVYSIPLTDIDSNNIHGKENLAVVHSTTDEQLGEDRDEKLLDIGDVDIDPEFRKYRILKQLALVGCWISIVSTVIHWPVAVFFINKTKRVEKM